MEEFIEHLIHIITSSAPDSADALDFETVKHSIYNIVDHATNGATEISDAAKSSIEAMISGMVESGDPTEIMSNLNDLATSQTFGLDDLPHFEQIQGADVPFTGNFTQADVDYYEHQARISSGSEQDHWIERARWAKSHLKS